MLNLFEKIKGKNHGRGYSLPEGMRVYAVGDIHGRADLLELLHQAIIRDARDNPARENLVIYLGDYLDRGTLVRRTLDVLIDGLPPGFRTEFLMGNHEQLFLDMEQDPSLLDLWINLGGHATLLSYQVQVPGSGFSAERARQIHHELFLSLPGKHLDFLRGLKPFVHKGGILFVHAGIRPGKALDRQSPEDLFWIREDFLDSDMDFGFRVIHGHTISRQVQEFPNRVGIDTGAYATGVLTCAVLENSRIRYLSTGPEA